MYNSMPPRGGGYIPRGKFQGGPPQMGGDFHGQYNMRRGNDYMGGGQDWRGGFMEPERDDFYPVRVSTHISQSSERYQKDWSKLCPKDQALESKLFKKRIVPDINFDNWKNIPVETSGTDLPEPIHTFKDVGLGEILENNIELAGILQPTPVQMYSTSIVKNGRDLMACAQTGSGKTAAFLIPMLSNLFEKGPPQELKEGSYKGSKVTPLALILAPTRELASQIFEMTQHMCYRSCVRPYVVYGGSNIEKCIDHLALGVEVLVATPGRLIDLLNRGEISLDLVKYLILDEADRMLDMGFEKDIRTIVTDYNMGGPGKRQTLMFSATFPKPIQILAKEFMEDYVFLTVGRVGSTNDIILQKLNYIRRNDKIPELLRAVAEEEKERILVFVRTKADTEKIQAVLKDEGFSAISIHGNKSQRMRENALGQFRNGEKNILVATEVAARGLDIPNIAHVINYDMPDTIDNYVHRIGRTGRMGNPGKATSFFCESDWHIAPGLIDLLKESSQEVPQFLSKMKYSGGNGAPGQKKTFGNNNNSDKFGGRDYRRGPQYNTMRYSNSMKPPGTVRNYSTNQPNFYNQMHPFNHMNYAPPYMGHTPQHNTGYNTNYNSSNRDSQNNERGQSGGSTHPSQAGQQSSSQPPLMPPPLIPAQQSQQQQSGQQSYIPGFGQVQGGKAGTPNAMYQLASNNNTDGGPDVGSSPVPNPSTPAPPPFPLYASSSAAAMYGNQFNSPTTFSPRNYQTNPAAQFTQQDMSDSIASAQTAGLMRPFMIPGGMTNIAGLTGNLAGIAPSWGAWQQENNQ